MMKDKTGRNDPCECGSGKKYKKCCLPTHSANVVAADFGWRKLRQLEGAVFDNHLIPYVTQTLPKAILKAAAEDFMPEELPEAMEEELLFTHFFMPWLLFNWIPLDDFGVTQFEAEKTIAQNYMKSHERKLTGVERRFINAMNSTYYSFYTVLEVAFEKALTVKDILLGTQHTLKERQGTHQIKRGDILFSRILTLDNQSIFVGMAPFIIPVDYHNNLIDFRQWLIEENENNTLSATVIREESATELLDYFFEIMNAVYNKPLPTLVNTDGELIVFSKSYFTLTIAPEEALNQLLPLTLSKDPEKFLQAADREASGAIKRIEVPWLTKGNKQHNDWENTVIGHITLEDDRLILATNSEKRTQQGKQLLSQYLGDAVCFRQTLIESPEQKLRSLPESHEKPPLSPELLDLPEVQAQIDAMSKAHWDEWFESSIPALDHNTPREAATTDVGREKLEALLMQYERHDHDRSDNNLFKVDIHYLRNELALDE